MGDSPRDVGVQVMEFLSLAAEPASAVRAPSRFTSEQLAQARTLAASSGERALHTLETLSELDPAAFVRCLGTTLHYPILDSASLFKATPLFDRVSLAQALKHEFILLQHGDQLLGVFADPFDPARLARIADALQGAPLYLVHAADLMTCLARHEESFHAVDALDAQADGTNDHNKDTLHSLSLTSIS